MQQSQFIQLLKRQPRLGETPNNQNNQNNQNPNYTVPTQIQTKNLQDFLKSVEDIGEALQSVPAQIKGFAVNVKDLTDSLLSGTSASQQLISGLDVLLGRNQAMGKAFMEVNKRALMLEARYESLNKNFRITGVAANELGKQFNEQARTLDISAEQAMEYGSSIKKMLPTIRTMTDEAGNASLVNEDFFKSLTTVQRVITTNMGLSTEAAERYTLFTTNQKQSASDVLQQTKATADAIEKATGIQGTFSMITEEIGKTTEDVLLQFGRMPGRLELAVMKGKALGLSLSEVTKIGTKMLDIESSVGAELEYQLLTGQRLVDQQTGQSLTNRFREAALAGDANKSAETLNELLSTQGKFLKNNLMARQKMADLLGMDEATLSRALMKRELLEKEGAEILMNLSGDDFEAAAKQMLESGELSEKTFKELQNLGDQRTTEKIMEEQLAVQLDQLAFAKLQLFSSDDFRENQNALADQLSKQIDEMDTMDPGTIKKLGTSIRAFDAAGAATGFATSGLTAKFEQNRKTDDMFMGPIGGSGYDRTLITRNEGAINLNNNDSLIAGTDLFGNSSNGGSTDVMLAKFANIIISGMKEAKFAVEVDPVSQRMA
jgi:hypothetical protein